MCKLNKNIIYYDFSWTDISIELSVYFQFHLLLIGYLYVKEVLTFGDNRDTLTSNDYQNDRKWIKK